AVLLAAMIISFLGKLVYVLLWPIQHRSDFYIKSDRIISTFKWTRDRNNINLMYSYELLFKEFYFWPLMMVSDRVGFVWGSWFGSAMEMPSHQNQSFRVFS